MKISSTKDEKKLITLLKNKRIEKGITVAAMAKKAKICSTAMSRFESAPYPDKSHNLSTLYRYAKILGIEIHVVIKEKE